MSDASGYTLAQCLEIMDTWRAYAWVGSMVLAYLAGVVVTVLRARRG